MLKDDLKKGVKIQGLFDLISKGQAASTGSWTLQRNLFSANVITFYADGSGANRVRYLPYRRGENAASEMGGDEVISGEFTGCIMGVYQDSGRVLVNHVDTEKQGDDSMPQKDAWDAAKAGAGFNLLNEHSTAGQLPTYLNALSASQLKKYSSGVVILCVASPTRLYTITQAVVHRLPSHDYEVLRIG